MYYVWHLQNFETGDEACFGAEYLAMLAAEGMVGNKAAAITPGGEFIHYGPGDGTTSVLIHRFPRDLAVRLGLDVPPLEKGGRP